VRRFLNRATRTGSLPLICRPLGKSWVALMWMPRPRKGRSSLIDGDVPGGNSSFEGGDDQNSEPTTTPAVSSNPDEIQNRPHNRSFRYSPSLTELRSGLLGRAVLRVFEQSGWNGKISSKLFLKCSLGTGFTRADPPRIRKVDITDFTTFEALINELNPSIIVHR
jgi:hypothetical protein